MAIVALLGVVVVLGGIKAIQIKKMIAAGKAKQQPPEAVSTTAARSVVWQPVRRGVGTLVAVRGVVLSAELPGRVTEILFENGAAVKAGDVLVRLDSTSEEAQLNSARADAALARAEGERVGYLQKNGAATKAQVDAAAARNKQTRAAVENLEATLTKKVVRAPFDGRVGIRAIELGQVVAPGTPIVSLQSTDPIYAEFQLPEQALAELAVGQPVELSVDVFPKRTWPGRVTTINPEVDPTTRNVRIRATVENRGEQLRPGMFASVEVKYGEPAGVLVVPATSVVYAPYGDSIYVLEQPKEGGPPAARQRFVRLGERRGDFVAVLSGLKEGETVVSSGAFKLRNGQPVVVNNAVAPHPEVAPQPVEQ